LVDAVDRVDLVRWDENVVVRKAKKGAGLHATRVCTDDITILFNGMATRAIDARLMANLILPLQILTRVWQLLFSIDVRQSSMNSVASMMNTLTPLNPLRWYTTSSLPPNTAQNPIVPLGIQPELLLMFKAITANASLSWVMVSQAVITDLLNIMSFSEAEDDVWRFCHAVVKLLLWEEALGLVRKLHARNKYWSHGGELDLGSPYSWDALLGLKPGKQTPLSLRVTDETRWVLLSHGVMIPLQMINRYYFNTLSLPELQNDDIPSGLEQANARSPWCQGVLKKFHNMKEMSTCTWADLGN
jgi:hypothetical protein